MTEDSPEFNFMPLDPPEFHGQLTPPPPVRMEIRNPTTGQPVDMTGFFQRLDAKEQAYRRFEIDATKPPEGIKQNG